MKRFECSVSLTRPLQYLPAGTVFWTGCVCGETEEEVQVRALELLHQESNIAKTHASEIVGFINLQLIPLSMEVAITPQRLLSLPRQNLALGDWSSREMLALLMLAFMGEEISNDNLRNSSWVEEKYEDSLDGEEIRVSLIQSQDGRNHVPVSNGSCTSDTWIVCHLVSLKQVPVLLVVERTRHKDYVDYEVVVLSKLLLNQVAHTILTKRPRTLEEHAPHAPITLLNSEGYEIHAGCFVHKTTPLDLKKMLGM